MLELTDNHEYLSNGLRKPGVTEIIRPLMNHFFDDATAMERGTLIHRACQLHFAGTLDLATLDPRFDGYLNSLVLWQNNVGFKPVRVEQRHLHSQHDYAGTWDADDGELLIDIKTGAPGKWHPIQTAAYFELARDRLFNLKCRGALYLQPDGGPAKFIEHRDRNDWKVFLSCLNIWKWKVA